MTRIKIPSPTSGGLILSYKCPAECRHCMYACSPQWPADWISPEDLEQALTSLAGRITPSPWGSQAVGLSDGLHFTGGEPFANFGLLLQATQMAEELSIPSTFVETNCSWCTKDRTTRDRLLQLKAAGLKGIMISVNPFYAEYVPFERTERCIRISLEIFDQNVMVYQLEFYRQFLQMGIKDRISLAEYGILAQNQQLGHQVEMFLMGRATYRLKDVYPGYPAHTFFDYPCQPAFLRDWHNHWDNYGNFMPGFCGGISLGHWRDMNLLVEEGIDLEEHPVLRFLIAEDIQGLMRFARDYGYQESARGYLSKCDLCLDIRRQLVSRDNFEELQPLQFYQQIEHQTAMDAEKGRK